MSGSMATNQRRWLKKTWFEAINAPTPNHSRENVYGFGCSKRKRVRESQTELSICFASTSFHSKNEKLLLGLEPLWLTLRPSMQVLGFTMGSLLQRNRHR